MRRADAAVILAGLAGACGADPAEDARRDLARGAALYQTHCATCHQRDGAGVPNFQPALVGSALLAADPDVLAGYVLLGAEGGAWPNVMPAYAEEDVSDEELALLLTYARGRFVDAGPIAPETLAQARAELFGDGG